jgi:hypothetical protein
MHKRKYFLLGVFGPLALLVVASIVTILGIAFTYDGKCGGLIPWLAGPKPCSFWEYLSGSSSATFIVVGLAYWPFILALLFVPPIIGLFLDIKADRIH